ncbi:hypothetical protein [Baekduia soli]|uniref:hypothetical protein n=1 Tax=Baekduia soli TaxID=496014 RepID=UPI0016527D0D|nr:hypothetical protein [Baekduia soli]
MLALGDAPGCACRARRVETQLSHVVAKVGVANRTELAAAATGALHREPTR